MGRPGPARHTSTSKTGRQIMSNTPVKYYGTLTEEQRAWNKEVDDRKRAKEEARKAREQEKRNG